MAPTPYAAIPLILRCNTYSLVLENYLLESLEYRLTAFKPFLVSETHGAIKKGIKQEKGGDETIDKKNYRQSHWNAESPSSFVYCCCSGVVGRWSKCPDNAIPYKAPTTSTTRYSI